jgi:DNA invertase Pin-like site-specific DNA recombinase
LPSRRSTAVRSVLASISFLHQQGLDTSTPSGRAMFQMIGVFAEFERAMIRERVLAGLARAKEQGISLGRRRLEDSDAAKVSAIKGALAAKRGVRRIARLLRRTYLPDQQTDPHCMIPPRTLGLTINRSLSGGVHEDLDITNRSFSMTAKGQ